MYLLDSSAVFAFRPIFQTQGSDSTTVLLRKPSTPLHLAAEWSANLPSLVYISHSHHSLTASEKLFSDSLWFPTSLSHLL